ncbi:MAG: aminopeptidase, partial [Actinobacteria bacterium]|nr:aminopeptidase [Actinomycetota bacterium]
AYPYSVRVAVELPHPGWCKNLVGAARVAPDERVIVVVDEPLAEEGSQLIAALADAAARPDLFVWTGERPLEHAPPEILEAAESADVSLHLQQEPRGEEGGARFELLEAVTAHGGRQIFMGFVDGELLRTELSEPAPNLEDKARSLLEQLEGVDELRIRAPGGTDLGLRAAGRNFLSDATPLERGGYANYPGGEVFTAPLEDSAEGVLVADLTVPYTVEGLVDEPVRLTFERGRVTSIEGGPAAEMLRELVASAGEGADVVAELGIGFYPGLAPRGHVMLDEKAAGTAHVAIGNNTGLYGGVNKSSIHVDMIFSEPEIEADGRRIEIP